MEHHAEQETRGITSLIDRELQNATNILTALAASHYLQIGDFEAFHRHALEISRQLGLQIVLRNPHLDVRILGTAIPFGAMPILSVPTVRQEAAQESLLTKKPVISDVFFGPLIKKHVVSVVVPVLHNGAVAYTLSAGIPTDQFAEIIHSTQLPDHWAVSIVDRRNMIVARSEKHHEFTGTKVRNDFLSAASATGVNRGVNREGIAYQFTYRRSEISGWFTAVGIPESVLVAPRNKALAIYSTASGLLLIIATVLSYQLGGRISQTFGALGIDRKPTREEFRVLFESAPNGVVVVDSRGLIVLANERLECEFGFARDELTGYSFDLLLPPGQTKSTAPDANPAELSGRRKDGGRFPIEVSLNPINTPAGTLVMATVVDLTARKQASERLSASAEALRASEDQRRLAVEAAELGTWTWDMVKDEVSWSDRLRQILGVPDTMACSHENYFERIHPSDRHLVEDNKTQSASGRRHYDFEYRIVRLNDQAIRWLNSKGRVDCDESGTPLRKHGVIQDVTARKAAEQARDDLRRQLMQAQEQVRLRLAHELHDETGQSLAAILTELKGIETIANHASRERLGGLRKQLEQMGKALHRVASELRPASIDELGLATVLTEYVWEWGVQFGIEADFHCHDGKLDELSSEVRTTIYRVVQEALTNIAKHASKTTSVSVVIDYVGAALQVTVEDNGAGFDATANNPKMNGRSEALGLAGMRERLALIGGELMVESSIGQGTTIFARIPLEMARLTA